MEYDSDLRGILEQITGSARTLPKYALIRKDSHVSCISDRSTPIGAVTQISVRSEAIVHHRVFEVGLDYDQEGAVKLDPNRPPLTSLPHFDVGHD